MTADAPVRPTSSTGPDDSPPRPRAGRDRLAHLAGPIAALAGLVAVLAGFALPFAPVLMSTPEVRWPLDPGRPAPTTLLLTAYEPTTFDATLSCRAIRAAAATPGGVVLATMAPDAPDVAERGLLATAGPDGLVVRSSGDELYAGPLPAGDCSVRVRGDAAAMTVALDGRVVTTTPSRTPEPDDDVLPDSEPEVRTHTPLPEVDALVTGLAELPGATAGDLSVAMVLDDVFDTTPAPAKTALLTVATAALLVGAPAAVVVAVRSRERRDRRRPRAPWRSWSWGRWPRPLPRPADVVVTVVLAAWTVLAPMTDDDGYYSAMAATVPGGGYVANYYQLYNQGFTPFSWIYYALAWWQETVGTAPVLLRIPSTVLGLLTWVLVRSYVSRARVFPPDARFGPIALRTVLAAAFLAWWLPYDAGVRPEPVVAVLLAATLVAVTEGLEARRVDLLGLAVGLGALGAAVAPTGFTTLAPLLVAAPAAARAVRDQATSWVDAAARWIVVLAPGTVGLIAGFADGSWRDFTRSQEIFAPIQRAQTWYDEFDRYAGLLDTASHFGSYARRTAVLVCLLALVGFLVSAVAARVRDLPVPSRLMTAGWSTALALALLLPSPSNPTHHFGALAGLGAAFLALVLVTGPGLVRALAREHRAPVGALVAATVATALVLALSWHGRNLWPYSWGLGMPSYGEYPTVRGVALDRPLLWLAALGGVTALVVLATRWRGRPWRRVAPAVAIPVVVTASLVLGSAWTLQTTAGAAARTAETWSPQADAWVDPLATRGGAADRVTVLDPAGTRPLDPVLPPPPAASGEDAFVPGGWLADPPRLPPGVQARGSFLVPTPGASADARTGVHTGAWFALPAGTRPAGDRDPVEALTVGVAGRLGEGTALRAEYARSAPAGPQEIGSAVVGPPGDDAGWRWVALLDRAAPPPGADLVRLVATDDSRVTGGWLAATDPVVRPWRSLDDVIPAGAPTVVDWTQKFLFPSLRQPVRRDGVTEPTAFVVGDGPGARSGLGGWTFDPDRGGLLGNAVRHGRVEHLTVRFAAGPGEDDEVTTVQVYAITYPYPADAHRLTSTRREVSGLG